MRLDRYLMKNGYGTKEKVHDYILNNHVFVNGVIISDFHYQLDEKDIVTLSNFIKKYKSYSYIIFNKPNGYVSSKSRKDGKIIYDILPSGFTTLNIVGRLDKDTTGLMLLTNNNKLYKYLIDPKNHIKKRYKVVFSGDFSYIDQDISKGIVLDNGEKTSPFEINLLSNDEALITLTEGTFHEVKNIFSTLHMKVISLHREAIHNIEIGSLKEGEYKYLSETQIEELESLIK